MSLSEALVKELQDIFLKQYGFQLSDADAARTASWTASFFDVLAETERQERDDSDKTSQGSH